MIRLPGHRWDEFIQARLYMGSVFFADGVVIPTALGGKDSLGANGGLPFWPMIQRMVSIVNRPSRAKPERVEMCRTALFEIVTLIGERVDAMRHDARLLDTLPVDIMPLLGPKRCRRLSQKFRACVDKLSADSDVGVTPRAFLASRFVRTSASKRRRINPNSAKLFCHGNMWLYNRSAQQLAGTIKHVCLSQDGVRAGGDENLVIFGTLPEQGVSSVLPIQVARTHSSKGWIAATFGNQFCHFPFFPQNPI